MRHSARFFIAAAVLWLRPSTLWALKVPLSAEALQNQSALIVVGKVQDYHIDENTSPDGSKSAVVRLQVEVESVEKSDGITESGKVIEVTCWQPVRPGPDGVFWEQGNDVIPGRGGRARFFLADRTVDTWPSHWPNGVVALDDVPQLVMEREPAAHKPVAAPGARAAVKEDPLDRLAFNLGIAVGGVGAVLGVVWWKIRKHRAARTRLKDEQ